ncbi:MAG: hypothetical protein LC135_06080 [Phycisphaerae bacterium]|nr:hypothetical protein [Phycisphaerae bacterium]MCZ2399425.1 hypothetical protein [Phycisphaerae bacterium]NUQ49829.1 hypothetical protein [Phycisphaerae bacterium]
MSDSGHERRLLERYADGELHGPELAEMEALLQRSPQLRARVAAEQRLRMRIGHAIRSETVPLGLRGRVIGQLATGGRRSAWRMGRWAGLATAAAALMAVAIPVYGPGRLWKTEPGPVALSFADFVRVHNDCAVSKQHDPQNLRGLPFSAAAARVSAMAGFEVALPDLAERGYALDGACLCLHQGATRVLHAYYRPVGGAPVTASPAVSVFSVDRRIAIGACAGAKRGIAAPDRTGRRYELMTSGGLTAYKWDEGGRSLLVCGHLSEAALRDIVSVVRPAGVRLNYQAAIDR